MGCRSERVPYSEWKVPEENRIKLARSASEAAGMTLRDIRCPRCGGIIGKYYSDARGHQYMKCRKCKFEGIINLEYFRRRYWYKRHRIRDYIYNVEKKYKRK